MYFDMGLTLSETRANCKQVGELKTKFYDANIGIEQVGNGGLDRHGNYGG